MGKKKNVEKSQPVAQPEPVSDVAETKDKKSKKGAKTETKVVPQSNQQKNVGKTKQIKKEEKPAKPQKQEPVVEKTEKKPKTAKKQETNVQIFTPEFYAKLNNFQTYYKQVLELKSSANNTELSHELTTVNNRVRDELQSASSNILKQELISLQSWIETQQKRLQSEIDSINTCYENNQKALQSTGAFAADEITSQLKPIQDRASQKQATFDHYGVLLARSRNIYAETSAAKPQEEEKVEQVNNNDNDDNDDLDVL